MNVAYSAIQVGILGLTTAIGFIMGSKIFHAFNPRISLPISALCCIACILSLMFSPEFGFWILFPLLGALYGMLNELTHFLCVCVCVLCFLCHFFLFFL